MSKSLLRLLSLLLTIALLVFSYRYIAGILSKIEPGTLHVNLYLLFSSIICFFFFYVLLSLHWVYAAKVIDRSTDRSQALAFFASQPYKYLPTSLFTFSFRAKYSKQLGMGLKKSSITQLLENSSMMLSAGIILVAAFLIHVNAMFLPLIVAVLVALLLHALTRNTILKFRGYKLQMRHALGLLALSAFAWIISGLSFILINEALGFDSGVGSLIVANTAAFSLGILAFFAPGGIGVRELSYATFLVSDLTVVIWRLLTFAIDFVVGVVSIIAINIRLRR